MIALWVLSVVPDAGLMAGIGIGVGMRNDRNVIIVIRHEAGTDATETEVYWTIINGGSFIKTVTSTGTRVVTLELDGLILEVVIIGTKPPLDWANEQIDKPGLRAISKHPVNHVFSSYPACCIFAATNYCDYA